MATPVDGALGGEAFTFTDVGLSVGAVSTGSTGIIPDVSADASTRGAKGVETGRE